jgi:hypothetical protein
MYVYRTYNYETRYVIRVLIISILWTRYENAFTSIKTKREEGCTAWSGLSHTAWRGDRWVKSKDGMFIRRENLSEKKFCPVATSFMTDIT